MKALLPLLIFPLSVSPLVHAAPGDDEGSEEDKIDVFDPMVGMLSSAAAKTFHRIYPGHRIWKVEVQGKDKLAHSVLTIFHPKSSSTHSQLIDGVFVSTPIKSRRPMHADQIDLLAACAIGLLAYRDGEIQ